MSTIRCMEHNRHRDFKALRKEGSGFMSERIYKVMKGAGTTCITMGVISLVVGIVSGILMIISGAKLIAGKSKIIF